MAKYRIRQSGRGIWEIRHPDGYWIGPGLGMFNSAGGAMDWLCAFLRKYENRKKVRN